MTVEQVLITGGAGFIGSSLAFGHGSGTSLSLHEASSLCRDITGHVLKIGSDSRTRSGDVRIYASDCRALTRYTSWMPRRLTDDIMSDIYGWIHDHERLGSAALANG